MSSNIDQGPLREEFSAMATSFRFKEADAEECVRATQRILTLIDSMLRRVTDMQTIDNLAGFSSITTLSSELGQRAGKDDGALQKALEEHQRTLLELQKSFWNAGKSLTASEEANKEAFDKLIDQIKGEAVTDGLISKQGVLTAPRLRVD